MQSNWQKGKNRLMFLKKLAGEELRGEEIIMPCNGAVF